MDNTTPPAWPGITLCALGVALVLAARWLTHQVDQELQEYANG